MATRHRRTHKSQPSWFDSVGPLNNARAGPPSPAVGYTLIAASVVFLLVGSYAVFFSAFVPVTTDLWDTHYKYLPIMLISSGTAFIIANWVGWQYYRNS